MAYLDATVPADSEAVTLGAGRIRTLEADLNNLIEQVWEDNGTFLPGWIAAGAASGGASLFAPGAIQSADIGIQQVQTPNIAPQAITTGLIAAGAITTGLLDATGALRVPTNSVTTGAIMPGAFSADSAGRAIVANGFVTAAMMGFPVAQIVVGSYVGSATVSAEVNTLAFEPDILILINQADHGIGIALLAEASDNLSPIHASWVNSALAAPFINAIEWIPVTGSGGNGGFFVVPSGFQFNNAGSPNNTYIAIAF